MAGQRSIPACAGESPLLHRASAQTGVYPRVCGGISRSSSSGSWVSGLSPRVRGNLILRTAGTEVVRSIPACAGESLYQETAAEPQAVYPRVCGGIAKLERIKVVKDGLSPRVRGNLYD